MITTARPRRRTFLDADRQASFEADGYVVVDLLDAEALDALRAGYTSLDHRQHRDSPFAEGFHTTVYDPRTDYRRNVRDLIGHVVGPSLDRLLDGHQVVFANFAVKLPHAAAVPHHLDWTFVDEDRFSSATVWCPLLDTSLRAGALGAVAGTHERVDFVRPVNHRDYERHAALLDAAEAEVLIPVAAGQAIVMDSRVVHWSSPNDAPQDRVVAAFVVAPSEAELVHWWVGPDGVPVRYQVESDFYLSYVIGESPAAAWGLVGSTRHPDVPIG